MPNIFLVIVKIKFKALQEDLNLLHIDCKTDLFDQFLLVRDRCCPHYGRRKYGLRIKILVLLLIQISLDLVNARLKEE